MFYNDTLRFAKKCNPLHPWSSLNYLTERGNLKSSNTICNMVHKIHKIFQKLNKERHVPIKKKKRKKQRSRSISKDHPPKPEARSRKSLTELTAGGTVHRRWLISTNSTTRSCDYPCPRIFPEFWTLALRWKLLDPESRQTPRSILLTAIYIFERSCFRCIRVSPSFTGAADFMDLRSTSLIASS